MSMTGAQLVTELKNRRSDIGGLKHAHARYLEVANQAIREYPLMLRGPLIIDTSILTTEGVRRYDLSTVVGLTGAEQVRRLWMDDDDGNDVPIGRWEIQSSGGILALVLDEDPPEAGRTITIEWSCRPTEVTEVTQTDLDRDWLCAKAMSLLLLEADPSIEEPAYITNQIMLWDQLRQGREAELLRQNRAPARKVRTWAR